MGLQEDLEEKLRVEKLEKDKEIEAPTENAPIIEDEIVEDIETVIDEEIEKLPKDEIIEEKLNDEDINELEQIIESATHEDIEAIEKDTEICKLVESVTLLVENSSNMIELSHKVISTDLEHSKQYHTIANEHIELKKDHYDLMTKEKSKKLKDNLAYGVLGGIVVYLFPEVLPYVKEGIEWLAKLKG